MIGNQLIIKITIKTIVNHNLRYLYNYNMCNKAILSKFSSLSNVNIEVNEKELEPIRNTMKINEMKQLLKKESSKVIVKNLPFQLSINIDKFRTLMMKAGKVCYCKFITSDNEIIGTVIYNNPMEANKAVKLYNNINYEGSILNVIISDKLLFSQRADDDFGLSALITNLSYDTSDNMLSDHLNKYCNVKNVEIILNNGGYRTGSAIVHFFSTSDTKNAIINAHNTILNGRLLDIKERKSEAINDGLIRNNIDSYFHDDWENSGYRAFANNISYEVTSQKLYKHLSKYAKVDEVNILFDNDGRSKGCAIVTFSSPYDTKAALVKAHGSILDGRELKLRIDREEVK